MSSIPLKQQYSGFSKSKPLWNKKELFGLIQFDFQESTKILSLPEIGDIIISKNQVLGKRIEQFFKYFIINSYRYELIANNLQVFRNKITIGELDFLIRDHQTKKVLHVELVYKFYLYDHETKDNELKRWIGPNRKDSLLQKIEKLTQKQLPLLYTEETLPLLKALNLSSQKIEQQVCYIANLFIHFSIKDQVIPLLNNECIVGYWICSKEFTKEQYGSSLFNIPQKKDWIVNPKYCENWCSFQTILEEIKIYLLHKKSPLIWIKKNDGLYLKLFVIWW